MARIMATNVIVRDPSDQSLVRLAPGQELPEGLEDQVGEHCLVPLKDQPADSGNDTSVEESGDDYEDWKQQDLLKEVKSRDLVPQSNKKVDLIAILRHDDQEFEEA